MISVYTREVAESKAREATDMGKEAGHPLMFTSSRRSELGFCKEIPRVRSEGDKSG